MKIYRHGGNIDPDRIRLDFSVNVNPFGMPEGVREVLKDAALLSGSYPDITYRKLREAILAHEKENCAAAQALVPSRIVPGNGASELIMALARLFSGKKVLLQTPLFSGYERAFSAAGAKIAGMKTGDGFTVSGEVPDQIRDDKPAAVVLCRPGNPTGAMIGETLLHQIAEACLDTQSLLIVDECFLPFAENGYRASALRRFSGEDNCDIVVLRALTKVFALPGLRLGYALCSREETAQRLQEQLPEWNVSSIAEAAGRAALADSRWVRDTTARVRKERACLAEALTQAGLSVYPGEGNFVFFHSDVELYEPLLERGILIRRCDNYYGIPKEGYYRAAVRLPEENGLLTAAVRDILGQPDLNDRGWKT